MSTANRPLEALPGHPGWSFNAIHQLEAALGQRFPDDLRHHLSRADGAEGFLTPEQYIMFWRTGELLNLNRGYEFSQYLPGLVVFATDGSDAGYGFRWEDERPVYVQVSLMGLNMEPVEVLGHSLAEMARVLGAAPT